MKKNCFGLICMMVFFVFFGVASFAEAQGVDATLSSDSYLQDQLHAEENVDVLGVTSSLQLPGVGEVVFKMIFFLAIVLIGVFGVAFALQFFTKGRAAAGPAGQEVIRVLSHKRFDHKKGIYLVDVLGEVLVIGADIDGLNLLKHISDPEKVAQAQKLAEAKPDLFAFNPFQNVVDTFSDQYKGGSGKQVRRDKQTRGLFKKIDQLRNRLDT